ncbi:MAG: anhydro-N-acetylmuramic acid kinase [Crocinitomicaceae bacterium]|nr:anhydro-N-acetylmuramic acid kinase [Crocinitomicaceae bacterium]
MSSYSIIGLMSGTSLDGLDIANCTFALLESGEWEYTVNQTETIEYPESLIKKLKASHELSAMDLLILDKDLGKYSAEQVVHFLKKHSINKTEIHAIASHGHTIFHQPDKGVTHQVGCGQTIAHITGITTINDFRQRDVIAGGQGAPLVPIGDKLLFIKEADALLNIGGISNVCFPSDRTIAFDICPGNLPLNRAVNTLGLNYDEGGEMASSGEINKEILDQLNSLPYYSRQAPKSLGIEWLEEQFYPLIDQIPLHQDKLATCVEHVALQIAKQLNQHKAESVLITGGGALNNYLVKRIDNHFNGKVVIPSKTLIQFKEAIIFGFLGALYLSGLPNCLSSVTGAEQNVIGGVLHAPSN